jgi:two-component system LytT family response regulator
VSIRVAIVDDERLGRERLQRLIAADSELELVAECRDGASAVEVLPRVAADLLFLDVQMPGLDGFAVLERLLARTYPMPLVVFVTAYDEHAVRAFDAKALDYLVKPFDDQRFAETLSRARRRLRQERLDAASGQMRVLVGAEPHDRTASAAGTEARLERIALKVRDRTRVVRAAEVDWIEADGVYASVHIGKNAYALRIPMHELERRLDARRFMRVHRSAIVNLDRVREVQELSRKELELVLEDGTRVKLSRSRRAQLEKVLGL